MLGYFSYQNSTKLYLGEDSLSYLNEALSKHGKNVVLVYGGTVVQSKRFKKVTQRLLPNIFKITQLETLDFSGKSVFPVMTHEGSGLSGAPDALKKYCRGAVVEEGLAIQGANAANSESTVSEWAKKNLK